MDAFAFDEMHVLILLQAGKYTVQYDEIEEIKGFMAFRKSGQFFALLVDYFVWKFMFRYILYFKAVFSSKSRWFGMSVE